MIVMNENISKINSDKIVYTDSNAPLPRPIHPKKCACGCGYTFQPKRRDQIYMHRQHANYAYNHGKRKSKDNLIKQNEIILKKNDAILHKHFTSEDNSKPVEKYLEILIADGFNLSYHIGRKEVEKKVYFFTHRYYYTLLEKTELQQIKIFKR